MNRRAVVWTVAGLVAVVAAVSFALSASALVAVAGWAGVTGRLAWTVPVLADGGALAFSLVALVRREQGRSAGVEWASLGVLAFVSVAANVAHGLGAAVAPGVRVAVGVAVVAVAPVVVLVATHTLAALVAPHGPRVAADVAEPVAEPVAAVAPEPVAVADVAPAVVVPARQAWSDVPLWDDGEPVAVAPSREDVTAGMRALREAGASLREVGARYGVAPSTVARRLASAGAVAA